ncbi:MAG: hypothetical protein AMS25_03215 [Gemmatimonas sp. SM23_52]|nr:MAG: hypothetical protein AMS25_03215 [Gemmatimonas sp. SM23_52]
MNERAEEILNELFPEGAADRLGDLTAHVYSRGHDDEIVVWLEGGEELGRLRSTRVESSGRTLSNCLTTYSGSFPPR